MCSAFTLFCLLVCAVFTCLVTLKNNLVQFERNMYHIKMVSALSFWLFSSLSSVVYPATLPLRVRKIAQKYKAQIIPIYFFTVTKKLTICFSDILFVFL